MVCADWKSNESFSTFGSVAWKGIKAPMNTGFKEFDYQSMIPTPFTHVGIIEIKAWRKQLNLKMLL